MLQEHISFNFNAILISKPKNLSPKQVWFKTLILIFHTQLRESHFVRILNVRNGEIGM